MIDDPIDCEVLVGLVTDWLEGDVDEPTRNGLELHVATCAGCIAYVEQMRLTRAALSRVDRIDLVGVVEPDVPSADTRADLLAIFRARRG